jgi:hypothetical protein
MHAAPIQHGCRPWKNSNELCVLLKLCGEKTASKGCKELTPLSNTHPEKREEELQ